MVYVWLSSTVSQNCLPANTGISDKSLYLGIMKGLGFFNGVLSNTEASPIIKVKGSNTEKSCWETLEVTVLSGSLNVSISPQKERSEFFVLFCSFIIECRDNEKVVQLWKKSRFFLFQVDFSVVFYRCSSWMKLLGILLRFLRVMGWLLLQPCTHVVGKDIKIIVLDLRWYRWTTSMYSTKGQKKKMDSCFFLHFQKLLLYLYILDWIVWYLLL